jgi:hypothetical protein
MTLEMALASTFPDGTVELLFLLLLLLLLLSFIALHCGHPSPSWVSAMGH